MSQGALSFVPSAVLPACRLARNEVQWQAKLERGSNACCAARAAGAVQVAGQPRRGAVPGFEVVDQKAANKNAKRRSKKKAAGAPSLSCHGDSAAGQRHPLASQKAQHSPSATVFHVVLFGGGGLVARRAWGPHPGPGRDSSWHAARVASPARRAMSPSHAQEAVAAMRRAATRSPRRRRGRSSRRATRQRRPWRPSA